MPKNVVVQSESLEAGVKNTKKGFLAVFPENVGANLSALTQFLVVGQEASTSIRSDINPFSSKVAILHAT